jgi:hypothetical protein
MPKVTSSIPAERLAQYERLVAAVPGLERKGVTVPYTSVNGNMSSFLTESGTLALRLSVSGRRMFIDEYATTLHEAHGTVMKEYVSVPGGLLADTDRLRPWFVASHDYVAGLKPKPTSRKG